MKVYSAQKQIKLFRTLSLISGTIILLLGATFTIAMMSALKNPANFAKEVEAPVNEVSKYAPLGIVFGIALLFLALFQLLNWFNLGKISKDVTQYKSAYVTSLLAVVLSLLFLIYLSSQVKAIGLPMLAPLIFNAYIFYLVFIIKRSYTE